MGVILDIKGRGVAKPLVEALHAAVKTRRWKLHQFLISAFNHKELQRIKKFDTNIKIGLLYYRHIRSVLKRAQKLSAYSVHFNEHYLRKPLVESLHRHGIKTFVWTVNSSFDAKRLYKLGVDGVISDYPDSI